MTQADFNQQKYKPLAMPGPFGCDGLVETPKTSIDPANPNFHDGFPVAYSSPKSLGGQYITRSEMNGIGNLASRYEFFRRVGGIITFDSSLSTEIGGYPAGAVLDYLDGTNIHSVYSLVDNNDFDFTINGVDGLHWAFLNTDKGSFESIAFNIDSITNVDSQASLGVFRAKKTGSLSLQNRMSKTFTVSTSEVIPGAQQNGATVDANFVIGYRIQMANLGNGDAPTSWPESSFTNTGSTQLVNWNGITQFIGGKVFFLLFNSYNQQFITSFFTPPLSTMYVQEGYWYGVRLYGGFFDMTNIRQYPGLGSNSRYEYTANHFTISGGFTLFYQS